MGCSNTLFSMSTWCIILTAYCIAAGIVVAALTDNITVPIICIIVAMCLIVTAKYFRIKESKERTGPQPIRVVNGI